MHELHPVRVEDAASTFVTNDAQPATASVGFVARSNAYSKLRGGDTAPRR